MPSTTALLVGLALAAGAQAATPASVILACALPARTQLVGPAVAPVERTFRLAPGSFQEWDDIDQRFGRNLCNGFTCSKTPDRLEGNIGSASVTYTIGIVSGTQEGYWRTVGASGMAENKGACRVVPAPKAR